MIKYLGSKRLLVPVLGDIFAATGAETALDLFTGTTRVAQEFKRRGAFVTAVDSATYAEVLARCFVETDATVVDKDHLAATIDRLNSLPGKPGYFTETFCVASRYFQPKNGARVEAIREALESEKESALWPILLTALLLAADRVDSTTGLQMAYLKQWAPRAHNDLQLRLPDLLPGRGRAVRGDALDVVARLPRVDLAYLDPPYNQHRYFTNYHVWETLVRWDSPEHYGVACKRIDAREDPATKSAFNSRRDMPHAMASVIRQVQADVVVVSYNDESWVTPAQIMGWLREAGHDDVRMVAFDFKRYVGAQIGIYNPSGHKVGKVSHLRNTEYLFVAGPTELVERAELAAHVDPRG